MSKPEYQDIINEYKEQVRILKQEVAELQDAGKSKDSANKRTLQKLEHVTTDLEEANKKIKDLIFNAYENQITKLIIVTGKGLHSQNGNNPYASKDLSILKYSVPYFIKNNTELMKIINEIDIAKIEDGGGGAFYIYLKKKI